MPFTNYFKHCDDLFINWSQDPQQTFCNHPYSALQANNFDLNGMPEPFIGNPEKCSAVLININPGGVINEYNSKNGTLVSDCLKYGYSAVMKQFPYWNQHPWWNIRRNWINTLFNTNDVRPFALEICPWHSNKWKGKINKSNGAIAYYIKTYVIDSACKAIAVNKLPYGLIIGKTVCDAIIQSDPNWKFIEKWDKNTGISGAIWPTTKKGNRISRTYGVLSNGKTKFLCTWAPGGNKVPSVNFSYVEKQIIKIIPSIP